jgi:hypothetical protein
VQGLARSGCVEIRRRGKHGDSSSSNNAAVLEDRSYHLTRLDASTP